MIDNYRSPLGKAIRKLYLRSVPLSYPYLFTLDQFHQSLRPRTYLEVGVSKGMSLALALPGTSAIGIDPDPEVIYPLRRTTRVFREKSDAFFASHDVRVLLGGRAIDLAFIDGMHQFEFALRDFVQVEKYCHENSVILMHDCYPMNEETADRDRRTQYWSGDVWKAIVGLKALRQDLSVSVIDVGPTGLAVITSLDPASRVIEEKYDECVKELINLPYNYLDHNGKDRVLNRVSSDWKEVRKLLPEQPLRSTPTHVLTAGRAVSAGFGNRVFHRNHG
jgi:Methyltransferase domain